MDEMVKLINNNTAHSVKLNLNLEDKKTKFVEKLEQTQTMCNSISNFNDEILKTVESLETHKETLPVEQTPAMCNSFELRII